MGGDVNRMRVQEKIQLLILFYPAFLFSLSFHETAHAFIANKLGDATAKNQGRISFNPLVHADLIGTILLPILVILTGARVPIGGWGKPVPVELANLKKPRRDNLWIAFAGPLSNLLLAVIAAGFLWLIYALVVSQAGEWLSGKPFFRSTLSIIYALFEMGVHINLGLAFFNLIPLHPLDGGKVLEGVLPESWVEAYNQVAQFGIFILIVMYYVGAYAVIRYPVSWLTEMLIPNF